MTHRIRHATLDDLEVIVEFNADMAMETENKVLDPDVLTAGIRRLLAQPDFGFYLVAEDEAGSVAGCLMITYEWSDWRNGLFWWVQSVYVPVAQRGRGVYRAMYENVKTLAREQGGVCGFRLYVEEHNDAAQATYRRMGMEKTHYLMFEEMA